VMRHAGGWRRRVIEIARQLCAGLHAATRGRAAPRLLPTQPATYP
jgi:hypothetical protein